uniref:P-type domain-containing protein n=1 Tax=Acrobeloides nanus TaxID=290746 RepID=A0A914CR99_9BILA
MDYPMTPRSWKTMIGIKSYTQNKEELNILTWAYAQNTVDKAKRIDCYPDPNPSQAGCLQRGCNFDGSDWDPAMGNPTCFFPPNTGYIAEDSIDSNVVTLKKSPSSVSNLFGQDFQELVFHVDEIGSGLHITIVPKNQTRYRPLITINPSPMIQSSDKLNVIKNNDTIFSFIIQRQSSGERIWDTSIGGLLYADKFLQIAAYLASDRIYGFGEHVHTSIKEVTLGPAPHLVYRTIGGQLEFFFFPGPTPEEVIQQFQQVIGTPFLPAYWALGFH